MLCPYFS